jgi:hypothetical protein
MVNDDPGSRLAALDAEINEARRKLASLRHEGERHFIDDAPVDPELSRLLRDVVRSHEELSHLRANPATPGGVPTDQDHRRLAELEAQIESLRKLTKPKDKRHFIDG